MRAQNPTKKSKKVQKSQEKASFPIFFPGSNFKKGFVRRFFCSPVATTTADCTLMVRSNENQNQNTFGLFFRVQNLRTQKWKHSKINQTTFRRMQRRAKDTFYTRDKRKYGL